jgi:hypothetical protein
MNLFDIFEAGGTGVIASKKQAHDPRYSMSLTKDVRPGQIQKNLRAFDLAESEEPDYKEIGNIFVKYCVKHLGIKKLPKIRLVKEIGTSDHPTFGLFDPNTNSISVAYQDRHIMDVLRTLAHELTHHKQREENRIKPGDGETGSDIENEANAQAGVIMRDFADHNPGLFSTTDRLSESVLLEKVVGQVTHNELTFDVDDHIFERINTRDVNYLGIDNVLKKMNTILPELDEIEHRQSFWVWDRSINISLGLTKYTMESNRFCLKTVVKGMPWDSHIKVIKMK